jgi:hypothetical protein
MEIGGGGVLVAVVVVWAEETRLWLSSRGNNTIIMMQFEKPPRPDHSFSQSPTFLTSKAPKTPITMAAPVEMLDDIASHPITKDYSLNHLTLLCVYIFTIQTRKLTFIYISQYLLKCSSIWSKSWVSGRLPSI